MSDKSLSDYYKSRLRTLEGHVFALRNPDSFTTKEAISERTAEALECLIDFVKTPIGSTDPRTLGRR